MKLFNATLIALLLSSALSAQSPCLIASYPFNGNASDVTGNGHDGVVHGATLVANRFNELGSAYEFDGIDDFIKLDGAFTSSTGTVTAWIRLSGTGSLAYPIASWRDTTVNNNALTFVVSDANDPDPYKLFDGTDLRECGSPADIYFELTDDTVAPEEWTHVAMTSDGFTIRLFMNGQESATHGEDIQGLWWDDLCNSPTLNAYLGYDGRPISTIFYSGLIDDVRIFDCALTQDEIDSLFQVESQPSTCLIASYAFDGDANDMTGNGHNGTEYGATPATDRFGNDSSCYQFDGLDDYIDISGTWTGSNGTISAYIYIDDLDGFRPIFQHDDGENLGNSFALNIDPTTGENAERLWFAFDDRECNGTDGHLYSTDSQQQLAVQEWMHVAVSSDDDATHLYLNCVEVATYSGTGFVNPGLWFDDMCPGPYTTSISYPGPTSFKGRIDDLRIFSCALTAEEIAEQCDFNTSATTMLLMPGPSVYPNPTSGLLQVHGLQVGSQLQLFDALGRPVVSLGSVQQPAVVLDLSAVPHGVYVLSVDGLRTTVVRD